MTNSDDTSPTTPLKTTLNLHSCTRAEINTWFIFQQITKRYCFEERKKMQDTELTWTAVEVVIIFLLALLTASGNLLVILAVYKDPYHDLRTKSSYLLLNLAIADFIIGLCEPLLTLKYWLPEINYSIFKCCLSFMVFVFRASFLTVFVLTFDRLMILEKPLSVVRLFNKVTVKVKMLIIWLVSSVSTILESIIFPHFPFGKSHYLLDFIAYIAFFLVLLSFYIRIFILIRNFNLSVFRQRNQPEIDNPLLQSRREVITNRRRKQEITKSIVIFVGVLSVCYLPYIILKIVFFFSPKKIFLEVLRCFFLFFLLYFAINPFIYSIRMQRFRRAIVYIFRCCRIRL